MSTPVFSSHRSRASAAWVLAGLWVTLSSPVRGAPVFAEADALNFTDRYCSGCHNEVDREGGLDLTTLAFAPGDAANFLTWVKVHDRVRAGEMPPREKKRPAPGDLAAFVSGLENSLVAQERTDLAGGRALWRRLNRSEYEDTLRDLLHLPWLRIKDLLPEDGEAYHFNKSSPALDVSFVHMRQYMKAADVALREAMSVQLVQPATTTRRFYARETPSLIAGDVSFKLEPFTGFGPERMKFPVLGTKAQPEVRAKLAPLTVGASDPVTRELEGIGWVTGHHLRGFGTGWSSFVSPVAGKYRLRINGLTLWVGPGGHATTLVGTGQSRVRVVGPKEWYKPNFDEVSPGRRPEPIAVYSQAERQLPAIRRLGGFDLKPEAAVNELEVTLGAKEWIVTDAARFFYWVTPPGKRGYTNPLAQPDGQPAVAFRWLEVEGPLYDESTTAGYRLMFGDLPLQAVSAGRTGVGIDVVTRVPRNEVEPATASGSEVGLTDFVLSPTAAEVAVSDPKREADRLLRGFLARAYRRPVDEKEVSRFLGLIHDRLAMGAGFASAMLAGYAAVLASPEFVFVNEHPGRLDDYALATRLALFLWNSEPDAALRARAARGELQRPEILREETSRMLADEKSRRFVAAFLDYWLDLRRREETTPSTALYPDYILDDWLTDSAVDETQLYFRELLLRDLPARLIAEADFTYLNERLARHYGIAGVDGYAMRRVMLPAGSVRGGLLTQASVLKVTANGTTTSPVIRGKWLLERILGEELPPPPASVPAVEPDIRGAVTIRQQLDRHRADESCAVCHRKIDPPGFVLESFDVFGGFRDRYRATSPTAVPELGFGRNGHPFSFHQALPVDPAGQLPDGRAFQGIRDFKRLLAAEEVRLARSLAKQLTVFATGAPVRFSDRGQIEAILQRTNSTHYGIGSIVHELIQSDLFRNK